MRRRTVLFATAAGLVATIAVALVLSKLASTAKVAVMTGAVIAQNQDPNLQLPVGSATVTAAAETAASKAVSESSGFFRLQLSFPVDRGSMIRLTVQHPGFDPFAAAVPAGDQIYVLRLTPVARPADAAAARQETRIANARIRYATRNTTATIVGTAVRSFGIENTGNVPCQGRPPCSPDGRWKAAINSLSLDTGDAAKQFRSARVSCIAGPCPFSAIETDQFSRGGRAISVSVRNWSDTVTYLLEAEVALTTESELIRYTYPAIFGRSMNFTLPAVASGPSIEAEVDGSEIVFPLGPELQLSWATCRFERGADGSKQYRCELKQGYRFQ